MNKSIYILLTFFVLVIAGDYSIAQRFRLEEADNANIEVNFDAYRVNEVVRFVWKVNIESNIRSYEIIRGSEKGRFLDWEILNRVNVEQSNDGNYTFVDNAPALGEMHYRLRLIAPDGSNVEYSPIFKIAKEPEGTVKRK